MSAEKLKPSVEDHGRRVFLRALFLRASPGELIELRRFVGWPRQQWFPATPEGIEAACRAAAEWGRDVYFGAWPRTREGGTAGDVAGHVMSLFCDVDGSGVTLPQALAPSIVVASGRPGHRHLYWLLKEPIPLEEARRRVKAIAAMLGGDQNATDAARVLRLPGCVNTKPEANGAVCEVTFCDPSLTYALEQVDAALSGYLQPAPEPTVRSLRPPEACLPPSTEQVQAVTALLIPQWRREKRHALALAVSGYLACVGWPQDAVERVLREVCKQAADSETLDRLRACSDTYERAAAGAPVEGWSALRSLLSEADLTVLEDAARLSQRQLSSALVAGQVVAEGSTGTTEEPYATRGAPWPAPLRATAFHGLAGDFVRAIEPHSEADPAAVLLSFLVSFGNTAGRRPHFVAEGTRHYTNLYCILVGETAKSRKGSSWSQVRRSFESVDPDWVRDRIASGLSSGEGLIWAVRDPIERREAVRERGRVVDYQSVIDDAGVQDKRLLVTEQEFASTLRVMGREGNTLSAVVRTAWDIGNLRALTKNSPAKATGAHISILAHITRDEVLRHLDATEAANGFGNRFLWLCVKRSKCLPEGGRIHEVDFAPLVRQLREAVDFATGVDEMTRDEDARALWYEVYPDLSAGLPGLLGAITARAEAQVMRLACVYALLDMSPLVRRAHLEAALEVWRYCHDSARFIFGEALGEPVADEILRALHAADDGLTRTDINNLFGRNRSASQITRALSQLLEHDLVRFRREPPADGRGRATERWYASAGESVTKKTK